MERRDWLRGVEVDRWRFGRGRGGRLCLVGDDVLLTCR